MARLALFLVQLPVCSSSVHDLVRESATFRHCVIRWNYDHMSDLVNRQSGCVNSTWAGQRAVASTVDLLVNYGFLDL